MGRTSRRLVVLAALLSWGCGPGDDSAEGGASPGTAAAPSGTDIWLARLVRDADGGLTVLDPANVTQRPGYDNQPAFLPDGSGFYYTAADEAGQADIWFRPLEGNSGYAVTATAPESEYSGTPLPDGGGFSAVRVEADSTQRLWRFDGDGGNAAPLFPRVAPVGYHAWVDGSTAVLYVLGDPPTLQVTHTADGTATVVAQDVGRSIQPIPGSRDVSYVQNVADGRTEIRRLDAGTGTSELIVAGVDGNDFHAWTPDGVLLQASGPMLYAFRPGTDSEWRRVADLSSLGLVLSRLAVAPGGDWIALVAEGG